MVAAMTRELTFTTWGRPVGQGNMSVVMGRVVDRTKGLATWKRAVSAAARDAATAYAIDNPTVWHPLDVAVGVSIRFHVPRPAGHYGTGRNADQLKPSAPRFPITNSQGDTAVADIDKQVRAILDALTHAGIFTDDSRVVKLNVEQLYAGSRIGVRAVIRVGAYDPPVDTYVPGALPIQLTERIPS